MSKTLPQPQFSVSGLVNYEFPKLEGSWEDTLALINYGKAINRWLSFHNKVDEITSSNAEKTINTALFKSLSAEQKARFKEVAKTLSYIIIGQKEILMKEYFNKNNGNKSNAAFYNEVEQNYFIHENDLEYLLKRIK